MRDFDAERDQRLLEREARYAEEGRDRSFKLGGEIFEYRMMVPYAAIDAIMSVTLDTAAGAVTDRINKALAMAIEPGEKGEALKRLESAKERIELEDTRSVMLWIIAEATRRPTSAPSSSGGGREKTGAESTDDSSSRVAEPAASEA